MERTAEILDTATGVFRKTGKGAVFVGAAECESRIRNLRENDAGRDATMSGATSSKPSASDEAGFEALTGAAPESPEVYQERDADYWEALTAPRRAGSGA